MSTTLKLGLVGAIAAAALLGAVVGAEMKPAEIVVVPSPYPSEVIVPSPYPSLVEVEVAVIPEACQTVIDGLIDESIAQLELIVSIYGAYLDYPDEDIAQFGRRVEVILDNDAQNRTDDHRADDLSPCDR